MARETNSERALRAVAELVKRDGIGNSLRGHDALGEPEGTVDHPDALVGLSASTMLMVKDMAARLTAAYPGFRWAIQPSEKGRVFNVFCLDFSGRWGYVLKYTDVMYDPRHRAILRAGREILLRFGYKATSYKPVLIAALLRNAKGEVIPDVSGLKQSRFTQRAVIERALADGSGRVIGTKGKGQIIEVHEGSRRE